MTTSADVFLGIIAVATVVMAVVQVGALLAAARLRSRVDRLAHVMENEVKPLLANLAAAGESARRATALAAAQVERADQVFADVARRVDETMAVVQKSVVAPVREGRALWLGVRTAVIAFGELRAARLRALRQEEEDALFIG